MRAAGSPQVDFQRLFEESPNGVGVMSCAGGWLRANRALCALLGRREAELVSGDRELLHAQELLGGAEQFRRLCDGRLERLEVERHQLRADGSDRWLRVLCVVLRDRDLGPAQIVLQTEDVTANKAIELELERERRWLAETQEAGRIGSWEIDLETGEQRWSAEQSALYGVDPNAATPQLEAMLAMIHPDDRGSMLAALRENMASGASFTDEYRVLHPTRGTRTLVVRGRYLPRDPRVPAPARLAGTTLDVTAERAAEAERRELAERQRLLLASLPDALLALFDSDLVCVLLEGELLAKSGIDPGLLLGRTVTEALPADLAIGMTRGIRQALAGTSATVELTYAGHSYLVEVWPQRLADGAVSGAFAVARDVTERVSSEEQLRLFATIVRESDDAILVGAPDGLITQWNDGASRMYGYAREEAVGRPLSFLSPEGIEREHAELLHRALAGHTARLQTQQRCKDGWVIDVALLLAPIPGPDGEPIAVSQVARDITAEMRAQQALLNSERRLYDAQALAHVGSADRSPAFPAAVLSPELCRILGRPIDFSPTEEEFLELVHPADREAVKQAFRDSAAGIPGDYEYRIVRPSGEVRFLHELSNPQRDAQGEVTRRFAAIQDITERKRYEAVLRRLATHDDLTGLPNRRTFDQRLADEIARARRHGTGSAWR